MRRAPRKQPPCGGPRRSIVQRFRPWFLAATIYNVLWGTAVVLFPIATLRLVGAEVNLPAIWQSVGMMVQVYALGYWLLYRDPKRYAAFIWIALLGKTFGPVGYLWSVSQGAIPPAFGWFILFNDLLWWPAFWSFALRYARPKDW